MFWGEIVSLRVSPHEQTTERKCLQHVWAEIVDMFCVLQDAEFVDLLMAVSEMRGETNAVERFWGSCVWTSVSVSSGFHSRLKGSVHPNHKNTHFPSYLT